MSVIARAKQLGIPSDQYVVIGSGLLDAWGLRAAADVDLVVSDEVFDRLSRDETFEKYTKHSQEVLVRGVYEIWRTWGEGSAATFESLWRGGITVEGVRFVSPDYLMTWKRTRGEAKDLQDVALIEGKLANER